MFNLGVRTRANSCTSFFAVSRYVQHVHVMESVQQVNNRGWRSRLAQAGRVPALAALYVWPFDFRGRRKRDLAGKRFLRRKSLVRHVQVIMKEFHSAEGMSWLKPGPLKSSGCITSPPTVHDGANRSPRKVKKVPPSYSLNPLFAEITRSTWTP